MRRALVTGGTGSIGRAVVTALRRCDHDVFFTFAEDEDGAKALANEAQANAIRLDFRHTSTLPRTDFHILINCAGINLAKTPVHLGSDAEVRITFEVNVFAPFSLVRQCLPFMLEERWGRVINVGSIYSLRGTSNNGSYNASKHALTGLTRSLACDYARAGITCNEVCPAAVESDMMAAIAEAKEAQGIVSAADYLEAVRTANPAGRMAYPGDVASLITYLVSDEAAFINGTSIPVDGGQIA